MAARGTEAIAPLLDSRTETGLVSVMNRSSTAMKRPGASSCGRWPTAFEDLEAAAGNCLVRVLAVVDGDDRIARAPDDEDGHALGEVEPVAGVDALAAGADDRAQRREEGRPTVGVGERRVAACDLCDVGAGPQPDGRQAASDRCSQRCCPARRSRR